MFGSVVSVQVFPLGLSFMADFATQRLRVVTFVLTIDGKLRLDILGNLKGN